MTARSQDAVALAERCLTLLEEGSFSATYKYALFIALLDLCLEQTSRNGHPPDVLTTRQVAEKTIELYWPHAAPFDGGEVLRQGGTGGGQQAEILRAITDFRREHEDAAGGLLHRARSQYVVAYERLTRKVEWKLIEMPIPRLQWLGGIEERFLYEYGWNQGIKQGAVSAYQRDTPRVFDNRLVLRKGVAASLVRLNGVLRPLIQREWARMVAEMNRLPQLRLEQFLFGATRIALDGVRIPLLQLQRGKCFYCDQRIDSRCQVDHFIPWARHPDNGIDNLVAAHEACNNAKRDFLAATDHVEGWAVRSRMATAQLDAIARDCRWDRQEQRTLGVARALYLRLPSDARLWASKGRFTQVDPRRLATVLA